MSSASESCVSGVDTGFEGSEAGMKIFWKVITSFETSRRVLRISLYSLWISLGSGGGASENCWARIAWTTIFSRVISR